VYAILAACDGSRPGLLGDFATAISSPAQPSLDAAAPSDPQVDAGAAPTPAAPVAMPSVPDAGSAPPAPATQPNTAPPAPMTTQTPQPTTPPATAPPRKPDYVAVATETVDVLPVGIEQYVCTQTDLTLAEDTWVTAIEVVPQHADYAFRASVNVGPGGACDALGITQQNVFDSFPSSPRLELRDGDALLFPADSHLQVQIHHSGLSAKAPSTDTKRTEVRLWTLPQGERPKYRVMRQNYHALNITIPIGAMDQAVTTSAELDQKYTVPGAEIIGVTPMMNYLGQSVSARVTATDGTDSPILDLDDWSIDSRKEYLLDPSRYIPISSGATHSQTCVYSNRPEDQAIDVDGWHMTPQLTTFGEDARNENCRMNVMYRVPL
jgi:hypothetical protein